MDPVSYFDPPVYHEPENLETPIYLGSPPFILAREVTRGVRHSRNLVRFSRKPEGFPENPHGS